MAPAAKGDHLRTGAPQTVAPWGVDGQHQGDHITGSCLAVTQAGEEVSLTTGWWYTGVTHVGSAGHRDKQGCHQN